MGLAAGWSEETFLARSLATTPKGAPYQNLCIGCDRFHEEVLGPVLEAARARRRARRIALPSEEAPATAFAAVAPPPVPARRTIAIVPADD
jgi:hypothetical protein